MEKKEEKSKFWGRLVESVVFEKQQSNQHSIGFNIGLFILWMEYWINEKNHFAINEYISSFSDGNAWPALTVKQDTSTYNLLENNIYCIFFA